MMHGDPYDLLLNDGPTTAHNAAQGFTRQYPRLHQARQPVRGAIYEVFLENGIRDAVPYTENATRKTVTAI